MKACYDRTKLILLGLVLCLLTLFLIKTGASKREQNGPPGLNLLKSKGQNSIINDIDKELSKNNIESLLETVSDAEVNSRISFEEFTDERALISHDAFGKKQMKIKVLEVSDENPVLKWKFGDRVKVTKIMVTIKHLTTQQVEEAEFDIEEIERELAEKRHYSSTNRWIPTEDIKNGYVVGSKHTRLISDASALDYIIF